MARLVLVEGLPGSGKTTTARMIEDAARARGFDVRYFGEGRSDHPADFEEVAILTDADLERLRGDFPSSAAALAQAAERHDGYWLVRDRDRASWPEALRRQLRERDAYDGRIDPGLHIRALTDNWRRFGGAAGAGSTVFVFEAVFLQNPICALVARFDEPAAAVESHVRQLASTVAGLDPLLVYLDAGDPEPVLAAAAAERPADWLDFVVGYHTGQGYGATRGLQGFPGLVAFMRMRRELELGLVAQLPVRSHVVDVAGRDREAHRREIEALLERHLATPVPATD